MSEFDFVQDYKETVKSLIKDHGFEKAMSLAFGGSLQEMGIKL